jgi:hypothetical protein
MTHLPPNIPSRLRLLLEGRSCRWLVGLALLAANVIFFRRFLFSEPLLYAGGETLANFFPLYHFLGQAYSSGQLPLWDPYYYFPIVGVNFSGAFYPPNILISVLINALDLNSGFVVLSLSNVLHYLLASGATYLLLRRLGTNRPAALLAGLIYAYSGFVVKSFHQPCIINTMAWFPLSFAMYHRSLTRRWDASVLAGLPVALAFLAGYLSLTLYAYAAMGLWALYLALRDTLAARRIQLRPVLYFLIAFWTGFALSSLQNLPTLEYSTYSIRHIGQDFESLTSLGSLPPFHFLHFLSPQFFGATHIHQWISDWVYVGFWEVCYYTGILSLLLAVFAVVFRSGTMPWFFLFLLLFSVYMAMGRYAEPAGWLYAFPAFPLIRVTARFMLLADLSLAVLSGLGLDWIMRRPSGGGGPAPRFVTSYFLAVAMALGIALLGCLALPLGEISEEIQQRVVNALASAEWTVLMLTLSALLLMALVRLPASRVLVAAILVLACVDLFAFTETINPYGTPLDPQKEFRDNQAIRFLRQQEGIFRISGFSHPRWFGHINKFFNLGYTGGFSDLDFDTFRGVRDKNGEGAHSWFELRPDPNSPVVDFYNIRFLFSPQDLAALSPRFTKVPEVPGLYENRAVLPRAYVVEKVQVQPDRQELLRQLYEATDLTDLAFLEKPPASLPVAGQGRSSVRIVSYENSRVEIEAEGPGGVLVMSDLYFPGWQATLNGKDVEILRANYCFRAVSLPPGACRIIMRYRPRSFLAGAAISGIALILASGVIVLGWRRPAGQEQETSLPQASRVADQP